MKSCYWKGKCLFYSFKFIWYKKSFCFQIIFYSYNTLNPNQVWGVISYESKKRKYWALNLTCIRVMWFIMLYLNSILAWFPFIISSVIWYVPLDSASLIVTSCRYWSRKMGNTVLVAFVMEEVVHLPLLWNFCKRSVDVILDPAFVQSSKNPASLFSKSTCKFQIYYKDKKEWREIWRHNF